MTRQETFDIVAQHLLTQNAKSERTRVISVNIPTKGCAYRGTGGLKCAMGILIPDDIYSPFLEGLSVRGGIVGSIIVNLGHDISVCEDLQFVHDNCTVDTWSQNLKAVAEDYGLDDSVVDLTITKAIGAEQ